MNSTTSTYWQEQQLMAAMIKGVRHKAKTMTPPLRYHQGSVWLTHLSIGDMHPPSSIACLRARRSRTCTRHRSRSRCRIITPITTTGSL